MILKNNPLFKGITENEIAQLVLLMHEQHFEKGDYIVREGEKGDELYFLMEGQVEILKKDWGDSGDFQINVISSAEIAGETALVDVIGELVLLDEHVRIASVRATQAVTVLALNVRKLEREFPEIHDKMSANLSYYLSSRLETTNRLSVIALKRELSLSKKTEGMSNLTVKLICSVVLYQLVLTLLVMMNKSWGKYAVPTTLFTVPLMTIMAFVGYYIIKDAGYSLKMYGLTMASWKKSVFESIVFSIPFSLLPTFLKWVLLTFDPDYKRHHLFDFPILHLHGSFIIIMTPILYLLYAPVQEFIFRGTIQSGFMRFFTGEHRMRNAIWVTNLIFMAVHAPIDWMFPFIVFFPGLFWGWLYARHRTLIGVSISHILLGIYTFYILGLKM